MSITFEGQVDVDQHRKEYMEGLINLKSNGLFTVSNPEFGRRTFRIQTEIWNKGKPEEKQQRVVAYLSGPDNTGDYKGFGFVKTSSHNAEITPWRRYEYSEIIEKCRNEETVIACNEAYARIM